MLFFEAIGADLHGHASGNLAHRREKRQAAARIGHRLPSAITTPRDRIRGLGQGLVSRHMQIGKKACFSRSTRTSSGCGSFTFTIKLGGREDLGGGGVIWPRPC